MGRPCGYRAKNVQIRSGNETGPTYQTYHAPMEGIAFDVLRHIFDHYAPRLAFRFGCKVRVLSAVGWAYFC